MKTLGILGGGQLARMLALAAWPLGFRVAVLQRRPADSGLGWATHTGDWDDADTLIDFARGVDVVTLENEFVDADALAALEREGHPLFPSAECIRLVQDKLVQKRTLAAAGLPVPDFLDVQHPEDLIARGRELGWPMVLKCRRNGYDGRGNSTIRRPEDIAMAWERLRGDQTPLYVESFCPYVSELAVMVTRARNGQAAVYPVVETIQRDHICHVVKAPAAVPAAVAERAAALGRAAVEAIGGVGSLGVEMFLLADGSLRINEMAPRVHNSGHYTIEACDCSQFENHVRAVMDLPLGSPRMRTPAAVMINTLGAGDGPGQPAGLEQALALEGLHVHVYGKDRSAKGRKMGHVTALGATLDQALHTAVEGARLLRYG